MGTSYLSQISTRNVDSDYYHFDSYKSPISSPDVSRYYLPKVSRPVSGKVSSYNLPGGSRPVSGNVSGPISTNISNPVSPNVSSYYLPWVTSPVSPNISKRVSGNVSRHVTDDKNSNYTIKGLLGKGGFGETYLAYSKKDDIMVAYKKILIRKNLDYAAAFKEVESLKNLTTPTCNQYIACYYDSFKLSENGEDYLVIISEYINGTNLFDYIDGYLPPQENIIYIFGQLLRGLKYIHENGYAHRDIKPENIMITPDNKIKYIDFGLACSRQNNDCIGYPGTVQYSPPNYPLIPNSIESSQAHDIWSLAVTFFMVTGSGYPFDVVDFTGNALSYGEILDNIDKAPTKQCTHFNKRLCTFVGNMLVNDIQFRPDVNTIIDYFETLFPGY
jgi:serine/threonine protein kinase